MYTKGELIAIHIVSIMTALSTIFMAYLVISAVLVLEELVDDSASAKEVSTKYIYVTDNTTKVESTIQLPNKEHKPVVKVSKPKKEVVKPVINENTYLLAQIIHAEAKGESYNGKLAVGNVILNRVNDSQFPDTLEGVIFQKNQFSPVMDGSINNTPGKDALSAAKEVLDGKKIVGDKALYFYNPRTSTSDWIFTRQTIMDIGNHRFAY